jgi:type I restriction enzyme M protein
MIVGMVAPQPGERICDPACGTAGFLISAFTYILRTHTSKASLKRGEVTGDLLKPQQWKFIEEQTFTGYDNDANMVKIAILNLYLHQLEKANIEFHNPLTVSKGSPYPGLTFDVVLANPPFAGKIQQESILSDLNHGLSTRATELLFLKWFIDHLTPGGRAGVIVPSGVLFGSTNAATNLRQLLFTECELQAVVSMPSGVFRPYAGVATAALVFQRRPKTISAEAADGQVWFYDMTADGFSLDDKRTPTEANDIPDVLTKWPDREEGPNSYRVPVATIRENDWSLAAGRYKPVTTQAVNHDAPTDILRNVLKLENEIIERGDTLLAQIVRKK